MFAAAWFKHFIHDALSIPLHSPIGRAYSCPHVPGKETEWYSQSPNMLILDGYINHDVGVSWSSPE